MGPLLSMMKCGTGFQPNNFIVWCKSKIHIALCVSLCILFSKLIIMAEMHLLYNGFWLFVCLLCHRVCLFHAVFLFCRSCNQPHGGSCILHIQGVALMSIIYFEKILNYLCMYFLLKHNCYLNVNSFVYLIFCIGLNHIVLITHIHKYMLAL